MALPLLVHSNQLTCFSSSSSFSFSIGFPALALSASPALSPTFIASVLSSPYLVEVLSGLVQVIVIIVTTSFSAIFD